MPESVPESVPELVPESVPELVPESGPDTAQQEKGKAAYAKAGCDTCHGPGGNGSGQGPALVPFTLELPEFLTIVRQGVGLMPGTPRDRVSDNEIAEIRRYLIALSGSGAGVSRLKRANQATTDFAMVDLSVMRNERVGPLPTDARRQTPGVLPSSRMPPK